MRLPARSPRRPAGLNRLRALTAACIAAACAVAAPTAWAQATAPKPRIEKAADLPRFSYPVSGKLDALVRGDAAGFAPLAQALRRDVESVLAGYEIPDKGTRRDLITQLALLDYLDGRYASALAGPRRCARCRTSPPTSWSRAFACARWPPPR